MHCMESGWPPALSAFSQASSGCRSASSQVPLPPDGWMKVDVKRTWVYRNLASCTQGLNVRAGLLGMIGASLMLCRCHTSFKVKLAVVVTVGAVVADRP